MSCPDPGVIFLFFWVVQKKRELGGNYEVWYLLFWSCCAETSCLVARVASNSLYVLSSKMASWHSCGQGKERFTDNVLFISTMLLSYICFCRFCQTNLTSFRAIKPKLEGCIVMASPFMVSARISAKDVKSNFVTKVWSFETAWVGWNGREIHLE